MRKSDASLNYLTLRTARFPEPPPHPPRSLIASESASGASPAQHPAVSPSAMSPPPASPRRSPSPPETPEPASCLYCTLGGWRRGGGRWVSRAGGCTCRTLLCQSRSLPVTPHCLPLPALVATPPWERLCINFLPDYRSHAKDNLARCVFFSFFFKNRASLCDAALPCPL